jgi:CRISPR-associated protein Cas5t
MLYLHIKAPFAAFRTFTAGSFRPTAPFITPSAAYGLLMNIAGIETRYDDGTSSMTLTASGTPLLEVAIGAITFPERQSQYQQLHNYPVGSSAKEREDACKGNKYNIQPIRREFLSGINACIAVRGDEVTERDIRNGLSGAGQGHTSRYGVPFLGDNSFMPDVIKEVEQPLDAHWYVHLPRGASGPKDRLCRLTVNIYRADMSRTTAPLFYPTDNATSQVPDAAWSQVGPVLYGQ